MSDPYDVLGVHREAGADDIKRAYRRLVRECHPDLNPSPSAERRFTQVSEAYGVLSDPRQRGLYDEFGAEALAPGFDPQMARRYARGNQRQEAPSDSPFGDLSAFSDVMGAAFGAQAPATEPPRHDARPSGYGGAPSSSARSTSYDGRAEPEHIVAEIDALVTYTGGMTTVSVPRPGGRVDTLRIRVKAGVKTGETVTLSGQGSQHSRGMAPGDLVIELQVREHPSIRRRGDDLEMDVPVTLLEAVQGGPITVPTPTGPKRVNLPPNCAGARLRLRGRGVQRPERPGHLILCLRPVLPEQIDTNVLDACRAVERAYKQDVRNRIRL